MRPWHLLIFLGLFVFQAAHLAADPPPLAFIGEFDDEGLWNHTVRCSALFGTFARDEFSQDAVASPLFTWTQRAVFSLAGVSIAAARIWPLVSLWLIMAMVYALMRHNFGANRAMLAVLMIGLLHELLFYTKWSTPLIPEACFLLATLYFWELGRTGRAAWMLLSAAALGAAVLTKLTAVHFVPAMLLFAAASYWLRKDVDVRRLLWFLAGGLAVAAAAAMYFLLNYPLVQAFVHTAGRANVDPPLEPWWQWPRVPSHLLYKPPLSSPGTIVVMMLASLWVAAFAASWFQTGFRAAVKKLSGLELYCACWFPGCLPGLTLVSLRPGRRLVMFFVPFTILAAIAVLRAFERRPPQEGSAAQRGGPRQLPLWFKLALAVVLVAAWSRYVLLAIRLTNDRWLRHLGTAIPHWDLAVAIGACAAIAAWYALSSRRQYAVAALLAVFFAINVLLNAVWYLSATYTVRDASRALAVGQQESEFYTGRFCYELSLENRRLPIGSPWHFDALQPNVWFQPETETRPYLLSYMSYLDEPRVWNPWAKFQNPVRKIIPPDRVRHVATFPLCPLPFHPDVCRVQVAVYSVNHGPYAAKP